MTSEEAVKVARIASMADGGCPCCVESLVEELEKDFPDFKWKELVGQFWNGEER